MSSVQAQGLHTCRLSLADHRDDNDKGLDQTALSDAEEFLFNLDLIWVPYNYKL